MATSNFRTQDIFPLFATTIFDVEDYEDEETGETVNGFFDQWYCDYCQEKIDEFNEQLEYYRLDIEGGYYCGVQIVLNEKHPDAALASECSREYWKECRAEEKQYPYTYYWYEFDLPYSKRLLAEQREIKKAMKYCRTYLKDEFEFDEYAVAYRFGNGETGYIKVNNDRARLIAAVCSRSHTGQSYLR